jgi:hypothetical protein
MAEAMPRSFNSYWCEVSRTAGENGSEDAQIKKATNKQQPRTKKWSEKGINLKRKRILKNLLIMLACSTTNRR